MVKKLLQNRNIPEEIPDELQESESKINDAVGFGVCFLLCGLLLIGGCLVSIPAHSNQRGIRCESQLSSI